MKHITVTSFVICVAFLTTLSAAELAAPVATLGEIQIEGEIRGPELELEIRFDAQTQRPLTPLTIFQGDVVLLPDRLSAENAHFDYDPNLGAYTLVWPSPGKHRVRAGFVTRPSSRDQDPWREAHLHCPAGQIRQVRLVSAQTDLEVDLPGALRVQQTIEDNQRVITAILGPQQPLVVRWKPQIQLAAAELVLASRVNTIVDVRAGFLNLDTVFNYEVTQGEILALTFAVPEQLRVTAVQGPAIRHWELTDAAEGVCELRVTLSQAQTERYRLQVLAEVPLPTLPTQVAVPAMVPTGGMRASGYLTVGTDSALQLVVGNLRGLTQIDAAAFPHVAGHDQALRSIPQEKTFYYAYSGRLYDLDLSVADRVPSYDVAGHWAATIKEDDLVLQGDLEIEVREAALKELMIQVPTGWFVSTVTGAQVADYQLDETTQPGGVLHVLFKQPVLGRTVIQLRLELGHGPLDREQNVLAPVVMGAKSQRGYVVVAAERGIEVPLPDTTGLRKVHTASVPLAVARAQYAYRFRGPDWSLNIRAQAKTASIRVQVFHLQSIGEALAHGSAILNFVITGSPIDELYMLLPESLNNVEFVGSDVRRWRQEKNLWRVTLNRKVIGDYSLAVTFTQAYDSQQDIQLGAVHCQDAQTQSGYVVVTSPLDVKLTRAEDPHAPGAGLLPISLDELPAEIRLLTQSPILAAYKYVTEDHQAALQITPYQRSHLLPAILDIANLQTQLAVRPDGRMESVTTLRYKIKNTAEQFLALTLPPNTQIWGIHQISTTPTGTEHNTRLAASHDQASGKLLIPLQRQVNPNAPITIQLEYGQVHTSKGHWQHHLSFVAPTCDIPTAYTDWQVEGPKTWAITNPNNKQQAQTAAMGLAEVLQQVAKAWERGWSRWQRSSTVWGLGGLALLCLVVCALLRRSWLPSLIIGVILVALLGLGIQSSQTHALRAPAPITSLAVSKAINTESEAWQLQANLIPAWRRYVTGRDLIGGSLVFGLSLVTAWFWSRSRKLAGIAILTTLLYLAARLPGAWPLLQILFTWLIPALLLAGLGLRKLIKHGAMQAAATMAPATTILIVLISLTTLGAGCAGFHRVPVSNPHAQVRSLNCDLQAQADHMALHYHFQVSTAEPTEIRWLGAEAVRVSPEKAQSHVCWQLRDGFHTLCLDRAGIYDVAAVFLAPLPAADNHQTQTFSLPLPTTLTHTLRLTVPGDMLIDTPRALYRRDLDVNEVTVVETRMRPGTPAVFVWSPQERSAAQETIRFYAQDRALAQLDAGLVQVTHALRLQIAQGQISTLLVTLPLNETVTAVEGPHVAAWRFDPIQRQLEIGLTQPVTDHYRCTLITQAAQAGLPYRLQFQPLHIEGAASQQSLVGLSHTPSVYLRLEQQPAELNAHDFVRDSADLLASFPKLSSETIVKAFRCHNPQDQILGEVLATQSELRSQETARFNVEDDRLIYNSQWEIEISKAGRFSIELALPEGYDVDALSAEAVSHWDEILSEQQRRVRVHFKRQWMGTIPLKLTLSQALNQLPVQIPVAHVHLVESLKHQGHLLIGAEQGVRLSVAERQGVSEIHPSELNVTEPGLLAFRLLRPDWELALTTEAVQPRITVDSLHLAKITDGLIQHQHILRYRFFLAGTKSFLLSLPVEAAGVTLSGAGIARREEGQAGQWRVELADKVFDRPYVLRVTYETRFDPTSGDLTLAPLHCNQVDLQQGYTLVFATDRVELSAQAPDTAFRPADARNIPAWFGTGDLSDAVLCYFHAAEIPPLNVRAARHAAAAQIGAEVLRTDLTTVVTETGQSMTEVRLQLRVSDQRHLQTLLPDGATLWSLTQDGRAVHPSQRQDEEGRAVLLLPLPQQAADDVELVLVYITTPPATSPWAGQQQLTGPRFNLPLRNINWQVYVPEAYSYHDFAGTLSATMLPQQQPTIERYGLGTYEAKIEETNRFNDNRAQLQQDLGRQLATAGQQTAARRALTKGYNFSISNSALNEDIRVDLDNLLHQQVKDGLVTARTRLHQEGNENMQQRFDQASAQNLGQAENENFEQITRRIIQSQAAAQAAVSQLQITLPIRGRRLAFDSPLQVESLANMALRFQVKPRSLAKLNPSFIVSVVLFLLISLGTYGWHWIQRGWECLLWMQTRNHTVSEKKEKVVPPAHDQEDRVSSEELL